jgi:hypothetical protein
MSKKTTEPIEPPPDHDATIAEPDRRWFQSGPLSVAKTKEQ